MILEILKIPCRQGEQHSGHHHHRRLETRSPTRLNDIDATTVVVKCSRGVADVMRESRTRAFTSLSLSLFFRVLSLSPSFSLSLVLPHVAR